MKRYEMKYGTEYGTEYRKEYKIIKVIHRNNALLSRDRRYGKGIRKLYYIFNIYMTSNYVKNKNFKSIIFFNKKHTMYKYGDYDCLFKGSDFKKISDDELCLYLME
jgi:hypothetical protein